MARNHAPRFRGDALEFQVFDHDMVSAADLLGRVILKGSEFDREDVAGLWCAVRTCRTPRRASGASALVP